jgi:PAS domain S-box-containing protein
MRKPTGRPGARGLVVAALLAPTGACAAPAHLGAWSAAAGLAAAMVAAIACIWAWRANRRLHAVEAGIRAQLGEAAQEQPAPVPSGDPLTALDALLGAVHGRAAQAERARVRAETELRESQERYCLAVRGATDGLWEWNFRTRAAYFSPRAKAMLGFEDDEIGHGVAEWRARIHPEDLRHALAELRAYIAGRRTAYQVEHRMRHRDGSWRWVQARATVVRHANGKPDRLIGLYSDITQSKRVQQLLLDLVEGLSGLQGEACLQALVRCFAHTLGVREAFICECCDQPTTRVRMLARWKGGTPARCVEFDLAGTACEEVIGYGKEVFVARGASQRWPLEGLFERDAYLGVPCFDSQGRVIGHVACADPGHMPEALPHRAVLELFALRASLELERRLLERERQLVAGPALSASQPFALH